MNNAMTSLQGERDLLVFVESAVAAFSKDSGMATFGDLDPGSYLALRWGLSNDCVLIIKLDADFQNRNYQQAIPQTAPEARPWPAPSSRQKAEQDNHSSVDALRRNFVTTIRAEKAESRVREPEAELSRMQNLFDEETRLRREATIRAEKAESRVRELEAELSHSILDATAVLVEGKAKAEARVRELEAALTTRDVKEAIGRLRGVAEFFEVGAMSAECDGDTLADAIEAALAGKGE